MAILHHSGNAWYRKKISVPAFPSGALGDLVRQLDPTASEGEFLRTAALIAVYQQAGAVPTLITPSFFGPSSAETLKRCPPAYADYLPLILEHSHYESLLTEWLNGMIAHGWRVPESMLPKVLNLLDLYYDQDDINLLLMLMKVIGTRGYWLAAQHEHWRNVVIPEPIDPSQWETAPNHIRLHLLYQCRTRDPRQGREMVLRTWNEESAHMRVNILHTLSHVGLSLDDEAFLEGLLDHDKSPQVTRLAAGLLSQLPDSHYVQRLFEYAKPYIRTRRGTSLMEITLPTEETLTPAMQRDRLDLPQDKRGHASLIRFKYIIAHIPTWRWVEISKMSPSKLMINNIDKPMGQHLVQAWHQAALHFQDKDWLEDFLRADLFRDQRFQALSLQQLNTMPSDWLNSLALRLIHDAGKRLLTDDHAVLQVLLKIDTLWSVELSTKVWEMIRLLIAQNPTLQSAVRQALHPIARYIYPLERIIQDAETLAIREFADQAWSKSVMGFATLLRFRYTMRQTLQIETHSPKPLE